jgi:L-aspartate oxidase
LINTRYLVEFDIENTETRYCDVLIIGSGIAGVYTALELPENCDINIISKETLNISNSSLAQGGIAVSLDKGDSPQLHFKDTIYAGAGLCDEENVWALVNEAAINIEKLCSFGVNFDRDDKQSLALSREGAHSKNRIIHSGDTTGKEVCDTLISAVKQRKNVKIYERTFAIDLITKQNECIGVLALDEDSGKTMIYRARYVVCASGGYGRIYSYTTNPPVATGDGAAMAYRAGAELTDMEFIQFHPTVLYHPQNKSFLISEAVRGEGAKLLNLNGESFMQNYHPMGELASRDVVSRAIFTEMKNTGSSNVFLDITHKSREFLETRFPNIFKTCLSYGIDISKNYIPVAPAEHYCMGGIRSDLNGRTNIKGLFSCGEATGNGIHGANRLASNSLLEGLVFGNRIAMAISSEIFNDKNVAFKVSKDLNAIHMEELQNIDIEKEGADLKDCIDSREDADLKDCIDSIKDANLEEKTNLIEKVDLSDKYQQMSNELRNTMTEFVGIIRSKEGLEYALKKIIDIGNNIKGTSFKTSQEFELINMLMISQIVVTAALERKESRGAHFRIDYPDTDNLNWKCSINSISDRKLKY